jgi:hypothetical protein
VECLYSYLRHHWRAAQPAVMCWMNFRVRGNPFSILMPEQFYRGCSAHDHVEEGNALP